MAFLFLLAPMLFIACGEGDGGLFRGEVEEIVRAEMAEAPAPQPPEPGLTATDVEKAIREAISEVLPQESGLTQSQVEEIVQTAIDANPQLQPGFTLADVEEAIRAEERLSRTEVEQIVRAAIANIPEPPAGLTAADAERITRGVMASVPPRSPPAEFTKFFVEDAISRYETLGLDTTLAYYNRQESVDGQWYVFIIDENDLVMGHPDPHRLGLDLKGWVGTDANGYNFGPDILSATEDGKWVSYVYRNPDDGGPGSNNTGTLQLKNVWVLRHNGLLFASGWYINADEFTKTFVATAARVFRTEGLEGTIAYFASPEIEFAGLRSAIEYYNSADNVEGNWLAFIADTNGTIIDHYQKEMVGKSLEDLLGTDMLEATAGGNWVTTEDMRVWVVSDNGLTFGSGRHRSRDGSGD